MMRRQLKTVRQIRQAHFAKLQSSSHEDIKALASDKARIAIKLKKALEETENDPNLVDEIEENRRSYGSVTDKDLHRRFTI